MEKFMENSFKVENMHENELLGFKSAIKIVLRDIGVQFGVGITLNWRKISKKQFVEKEDVYISKVMQFLHQPRSATRIRNQPQPFFRKNFLADHVFRLTQRG